MELRARSMVHLNEIEHHSAATLQAEISMQFCKIRTFRLSHKWIESCCSVAFKCANLYSRACRLKSCITHNKMTVRKGSQQGDSSLSKFPYEKKVSISLVLLHFK